MVHNNMDNTLGDDGDDPEGNFGGGGANNTNDDIFYDTNEGGGGGGGAPASGTSASGTTSGAAGFLPRVVGIPGSLPLPVEFKLGENAADNNSGGAAKQQGQQAGRPRRDFQLQQDIYTLLFTAPFSITSHSFLYCVFFAVFQFAVIGLTLTDLFKDGTPDNALAVPPAVDTVVSVAQFSALFIAVLTTEEFTTTLYLLSVGYDPEQVPPAASRAKWILSIVIRFVLGTEIIFICFVFIVQSTSVIDLFKDFAAIVFVADIQDAAFALAQRGFVTDQIQEATIALEDVHFTERDDTLAIQIQAPIRGRTTSSCCGNCWPRGWRVRGRQIVLFVVYGVLVGIWAWLYSRQQNGDFIASTIQVQFGDETYGDLQYAFFSGMYELARNERLGGRPVYYERGEASGRSSGKFFYCQAEEAWVFTIANITTDKDRYDDCRWLFRSPTTNGYDLASESSEGWKVWTGRIQLAKDFRLAGAACSDDSDCNYHGSCESDGRCECEDGWAGKFCEFADNPCEKLVIYIEDEPILIFSLLKDGNGEHLMVYDRPVYYAEDGEGIVVVLYTGRRWFITEWGDDVAEDVLRSLLSQPFVHAHWSQIYSRGTQEFSEPTESFVPAGGGVTWDSLGSSRSRGDFGPLGFWRDVDFTTVHCESVDCSVDMVCGNAGECQNGTCICNEGRAGHFCQLPFAPDISDTA